MLFKKCYAFAGSCVWQHAQLGATGYFRMPTRPVRHVFRWLDRRAKKTTEVIAAEQLAVSDLRSFGMGGSGSSWPVNAPMPTTTPSRRPLQLSVSRQLQCGGLPAPPSYPQTPAIFPPTPSPRAVSFGPEQAQQDPLSTVEAACELDACAPLARTHSASAYAAG
eukprot:scaffold416_cov105-Isochrysis_galbana.AAC.4